MASWKQATDTYLASWTKAFDSMSKLPAATEPGQKSEKNSLGAQAAAREVSRQALEPMVQLAGGVPLSEFRRLMDQVHGIHLRLDKIEDQLRLLTAGQAKKKKRG